MRSLAIALMSVAAVATAACGTTTAPEESTVTVTQTPSATSEPTSTTSAPSSPTPSDEPTACGQLGGTVAGTNCTVHEVTPKYTVDMIFPTDYPDQQSLIDLLNNQRQGFLDLVNERPDRPDPYALDIKSTSYQSADTVSLVLQEYSNTGGAHPETYYDALNYDTTKKAPITFEQLFTPGSDPVATLDPIVQAELTKRLDGYELPPNPSGADMYKNFALTDDAVIFFLGQGVWAFEAAGPQEITIPRSELASILA